MLKLTERQTAWGRFFTLISCIIFGIIILFNGNTIKTEVRELATPVLMSTFYDMSGSNVRVVKQMFKTIIKQNSDVLKLELYKFTPEKNSNLYNGQINVVTAVRKGNENVNKTFIPMVASNDNIREILLNTVHHDTVSTLKTSCESEYISTRFYTCSKYTRVESSAKSIVSIPIVDNTGYKVLGYVTITLKYEYTNDQIQILVNGLQADIRRIQILIKS